MISDLASVSVGLYVHWPPQDPLPLSGTAGYHGPIFSIPEDLAEAVSKEYYDLRGSSSPKSAVQNLNSSPSNRLL